MKYALVISGVLAALAMAAPTLVVLGFIFLILPGFILLAAPTVFVYLAATEAVRRLVMKSTSARATAAAFGLVLLLSWAVMQPFRSASLADHSAASLPDVTPANVIELDGDVRLERPDSRREPECDHLTLTVLDSPGVRSVTTSTGGPAAPGDDVQSIAYALVSADTKAPVGPFPSQPGRIVHEDPRLTQLYRGREIVKAAKAVEASWALRLCGQERLRQVESVPAEKADWVVKLEDRHSERTTRLRRITICDASGAVCYRKSYRKQAVPAPLFYFGFGGTLENSRFRIGRQVVESGTRSFDPVKDLLTAVRFPIPRCDLNDLAVLRERVERVLDDSAPTKAQLELTRRWLGLFFFDATDQDDALIARIVADDRIENLDESLRNVFRGGELPVSLRDAFAERILMDHTSGRLRHWLAERLADLPRGTFADPSEEHVAIWTTPEIYQDAGPFLATLADIEPERAVPMLASALETALARPDWSKRRQLVDGVREAFVRIGPEAASAVPRIRELFLRRPSPILRTSKDADQWRFALARMGVPVEELPVFPNQSPQMVEQICRRIADKLQRYERDQTEEIAS